jgi:tetratricopeptide (TPR) repeat protein
VCAHDEIERVGVVFAASEAQDSERDADARGVRGDRQDRPARARPFAELTALFDAHRGRPGTERDRQSAHADDTEGVARVRQAIENFPVELALIADELDDSLARGVAVGIDSVHGYEARSWGSTRASMTRSEPPASACPPPGERADENENVVRPRGLLLAAGVVGVVSAGVGFLPLFGGPGYEAALAAGLLVPVTTLVSLVVEVPEGGAVRQLVRGLRRGLLLGTLAYLVSLLHGLRAGFCSLSEGTAMFALGPLAGALLAGAIGGGLAFVRRRRGWRARVAIGLALAAPLSTIVAALLFGYFTPIVFAFDPFVGFFSGTLYDTVIDSVPRLLTYRAGTVLTLVALASAAVLFDAFEPSERGSDDAPSRLRRVLATHPLTALSLVAATAGSAALVGAGDKLDHWHTAATIRADLGAIAYGQRCEVVHPTALTPQAAALLVRDCDAQAAEIAEALGVKDPPRITAFFFANSAEKRRLMGAADTYIAKPWRREVYLQMAAYPHPVLGHEIAHVLAGTFAPGPLHVAGRLRGFWPDPGLIEGMAVAAASEDDELSPGDWCRAMLDLGLLPRLDTVFSLGFLGHSSSRAYTVAGAFVRFVREAHGKELVARWYGGEALPTLTGQSWAELESGFRESLRGRELTPAEQAFAKARFDRPAIFGRVCPHVLDADKRLAFARLGGGDATRAKAGLLSVLARDPHDASARLGLSTCEQRLGDATASVETLRKLLQDDKLPSTYRLRAEERLGDLAYARHDVDAAKIAYDRALALAVDEDTIRTLEVKRLGVSLPREGEGAIGHEAIAALLVGTETSGPDTATAYEALGRYRELAPRAGLPRYLLGRNAVARGDYARGAALLAEALDPSRELPLESVRREAARQGVIAACALGDGALVEKALDQLARTEPAEGAPSQRTSRLRALAARCVSP